MSCMGVLGPIKKEELGVVTPHEHVFIDMRVFFSEPEEIGRAQIAKGPVTIEKLGVLKRDPFAVEDNVIMEDFPTQRDELLYFRAAGGNTIVDASTIGLGRDPALLRRMSVETGLNIVCGAGYYVEDAQRPEALSLSVDEMEKRIVREIESGFGDSGVRAGVIGEIGVSHEMLPFERRSLIAACRAQRETGAPLMIHINPWSTQGISAMEIVKEYGVPNDKVVICHSDVENREDYIDRLLDMGVYVEFDNFGKEMNTDLSLIKPGNGRFVTDWQRVHLLERLLSRGYEKQLLLSCDVCLKSLLHRYGGWGYDHVLTHIVPMLDEVGVSRMQIDRMLRENPARWLCD